MSENRHSATGAPAQVLRDRLARRNQVDQYGGYTGTAPRDVAAPVHRITDEAGLPRTRVVLGGDHLGPNRRREPGADQATDRADVLVAEYVRDAGRDAYACGEQEDLA